MKFMMYSTDSCSYCSTAKNTLLEKGHEVEERNIVDKEILAELMTRYPGAKTVPQIFLGEIHIGGCDVLLELIQSGAFEKIINA